MFFGSIRTRCFLTLRLGMAVAVLAPTCLSGQEAQLEYNRDVRPILADACFACHGPDSAARKAGLRLDRRDDAISMGAIVPNDADASELVARLLTEDPETIMPPPASHKVLTSEQKQVLIRWIEEGAEYQPHWSFIAPVRPEVPAVQQEAWVRSPIDRFVLARLEAEGLQPAPEADRRTLARRLSLDLTGLPPTPEQVEAFVADTSPDAYDKYVDQLLESERWGEHRGRFWLDYARYADTHGIHFDNYREMWSYRDWVINAFNDNMPYDRFTIENLAGDLIPGRSLDQQIGSGFNRCNMTTNEGGIIAEEYLVLYTRDRTETTSTLWLGLTANCATCHDHKFDPLSQAEFYSMAAFFNNTTQGAFDGNIKDTPPIIAVPRIEDRARWDALITELPAAQAAVEARRSEARADFDQWLANADPAIFASKMPGEAALLASLSEGTGSETAITIAGETRTIPLAATANWRPGHVAASAIEVTQGGIAEISDFGDFDVDQPFSMGVWIKLPANDGYGAIASRIDAGPGYRGWDFWVQQRRIGMHLIHGWPDNALKIVSNEQIPADRWVHVQVTYDGSRRAAGVKVYFDGVEKGTNVENDTLTETTRTTVPFKIGQRSAGEALNGAQIQQLRIDTRVLDAAEIASLSQASRLASLVEKPRDALTAEEREELFAWWLPALDESFVALRTQAETLERERNDIQARGTIAHVMQERDEAAKAYVLFRGDYDKRRDEVVANTPAVLPPFPADMPRNRLGFAQWLLLPEHPLTARVTVNRFWQEVFGAGLVRSTGDFGITGDLPSHPELLDWMAVEFRESGWDVKQLFRMMVTSATYRQAAIVAPEKLERDPENRLLARGPRFRMDAEMIRDAALAASGLMVGKIGGPSVKPYQPPGVWEAIAMNVSNTRSYDADQGEGLYRRSMYTFWKRMAPPASMEIFNAPNREFCVVRRERTNTPLQALAALNDEQFIEAARVLAQNAMKAEETFENRLTFITTRLVSRPFQNREIEIAQASYSDLLAWYSQHPEEAQAVLGVGHTAADASLPAEESAAWTLLVNQLMNLDEALVK